MKPHVATLLILVLTSGILASQELDSRSDNAAAESLGDAIKTFNLKYPDKNPLTEPEVIAAIRRMKGKDPDVPDSFLAIYHQVVELRILPKGMSFKKGNGLFSGEYYYEVDWKDLFYVLEDGSGGYNLRIRERLISSVETTAVNRDGTKEID